MAEIVIIRSCWGRTRAPSAIRPDERGSPMRTVMVSLAFLGLARAWKAAEIEAVSRRYGYGVSARARRSRAPPTSTRQGGAHARFPDDLPAGAVDGLDPRRGQGDGQARDRLRRQPAHVRSRRRTPPRPRPSAAIEDELERAERREGGARRRQMLAAETQKTLITNLTQLPTRPAPAAGAERGEDWPAILALIASGSGEAQRARLDAQVKKRDLDRNIEDLEKKLSALAPARDRADRGQGVRLGRRAARGRPDRALPGAAMPPGRRATTRASRPAPRPSRRGSS